MLLAFCGCAFLAACTAISTPIHRKRSDPVLPDFILRYAPFLYLSRTEQWWPTDVTTFFLNTSPQINFVPYPEVPSFANLSAIPYQAYLTADDDVQDNPAWLYNIAGQPNATAYSAAPVTIIQVPKANNTVDAFFFFFYAFNEGKEILDVSSFGNHLGDWEHVMVRFHNGSPTYIFLSQHSNGVAYPYSALLPTNGRATVYIAEGDHAHYAFPGVHVYSDVLTDVTDAGYGWDPLQNYRAYTLDMTNNTWIPNEAVGVGLTASEQDNDGGNWLFYEGGWGDEQYPNNDPRQLCIFSKCRYGSGPNGPYYKNLGRTAMCTDETQCVIQTSIYDK
ncbi:MAG: Vacuolar protein sorting-associated protein 62 [Cyphobasidiales sp. Tagirdzhanova-0007]|nr:MAG: Vacuolar protein sorting-associated protein 62 [Cyphobasidiales sp. Tagirdzhanova-0007]